MRNVPLDERLICRLRTAPVCGRAEPAAHVHEPEDQLRPRARRALRPVVEVHRTLAGGGQTVAMTVGYEPLEDRLEEMVALWDAASAGEWHRALVLRSPSLGDSHDAFESLLLFRRSVHGDRPEGAAETAMMLLLTDWRWRRGTGRLVRAIEESGLVPEDDLDLLARAFRC
jgi:hypothetical protein